MADEAMEIFWEDLDIGEVYIRDKWQFALKSEFFPQKGKKKSLYIQEFYLFIPNSLQINTNTYPKEFFYLDQTNLIRYKTPEFTFEAILDTKNEDSPLTHVNYICDQEEEPLNQKILSEQLKLLANVIRSTLRQKVKELIQALDNKNQKLQTNNFSAEALKLCQDIRKVRDRYVKAQSNCLDNWHDPLFYRQMLYIDEFMSYSISYYLTGLLKSVRLSCRDDLAKVDEQLCEVLLNEKQLSDKLLYGNKTPGNNKEGENVLYRYSLLNKFVLDPLQLMTNRFSLNQKYQHWFAGVSAGVAISIYFLLFLWLGNVFVINSAPFLLIMVVCYILKDRIKEWLRNYSYLMASRWFPDYTTVITSHDEKENLGVIKESFSIIDPLQLSKELNTMRNAAYHSVLETVQRPENVLFYKRVVKMNPLSSNNRYNGINVIFRFNISLFLRKAADIYETHLRIDSQTKKLLSIKLPKVYHLNLIIRSTFVEDKNHPQIEYKKFRLVIDKDGIKRIEREGK
jgi:hypothetical protein